MRKIIVAIAMALAIQMLAGCMPTDLLPDRDETPEEEPPYTISDWDDGGTIYTEPDSVRDATHEDSVRFGLI